MLDADLRELALTASLGFLEAKHFSGIIQTNRPCSFLQPRDDRLGDERRELGPKGKDISVAVDEAVDLLLQTRSHSFYEDVVVIEDRWDDLFIRPALEDRTDCPLQSAPPSGRASEEDLCPRRNLGKCFHPSMPF